MIERRSMRVGAPYEANVFCALCAEELAHSQAAVDLHVRSLEHVINYVHKYHTHRLKEMLDKQAVNDDGKELRRFLGQLLKDEGAPNNMRVYDPNGMHEERKK
ncbi:unnamed protein product, partial [Gongylonema pulchrum]|uniref:Zf-U1 domain-containing protein n=1 Tax=Gongylonema pulchrum TaxID=637853 RepID=A0A183DMD7_9BILA